jgi:hypothetical protein
MGIKEKALLMYNIYRSLYYTELAVKSLEANGLQDISLTKKMKTVQNTLYDELNAADRIKLV